MNTQNALTTYLSFAKAALSAVVALVIGIACALASVACAKAATPSSLEIYFIDVEGGQSTLVITPDRHSLLIDTGYAGDGSAFRLGDPHQARDANRIVAAARDAGIRQIDYLLITHFHPDHDGGVTELSQLMPIRTFIDHGDPSPQAASNVPETADAFNAYSIVRSKGRHLQPHVGGRLPLRDLEVIVVSSAGSTLAGPLPSAGASNAACQQQATAARDPYENPRSTGVIVRYGKFRFLDVGDLTGQPLFNLACPKDLIGPVDTYLVAHHGGADVDVPATFAAFKPRIAIMNNGLTKGGSLVTYQALHHVLGLEDVWQLHASADAGDSNYPGQYIANLDENTSHWLKLTARQDGSFRVSNPRTGDSKTYAPRSVPR
jgi:competence protein ComEC